MWLTMERRVCRGLNLRHDAHLIDPDPDADGRTALVLQAAHTVLPEAGVEQLPTLARSEVERGLGGELRERFADVAEPDDPWGRSFLPGGTNEASATSLTLWRDQLIDRLGDHPDLFGALAIADQVHLRRLALGEVPPVVAAECVAWYGAYRTGVHPNADAVARVVELFHAWLERPERRDEVDQSLGSVARAAVGDESTDLLDAQV